MMSGKGCMARMCVLGILAAGLIGFLLHSVHAADQPERFFLVGDGRLHIKNVKTGVEADKSLICPDGSLNEEGLAAMDEVFGFHGPKAGEHISLRLLFMLDHFSDLAAPGKLIHLTSGYRSPEYNEKLRNAGGNVAGTSLHMDGMALDFSIEGISGKELWTLIKSRDCCGVGHYGGATIHLDSARPRFWEAATSKVRTGESEFNRRIYLSTELDRYRGGETIRLCLVSVSDFGFGISRAAHLVMDKEGHRVVGPLHVAAPGEAACVDVSDRQTAGSIRIALPEAPAPGRYRIKLDFCRKPFDQMPSATVSNEIEVLASSPHARP